MAIHRDVFMEVCPEDLRRKMEDFMIHYNEKKRTAAPHPSQSGESSSGAGNHSARGRGNRGRGFHGAGNRGNRMAGPKGLNQAMSEFDKFLTDFKGILSKLNDTNRDAIWAEIQTLNLQRCLPNYVPTAMPVREEKPTGNDGWTTIAHKKGAVMKAIECEEGQWRDIVRAVYQYTRSCHMYMADYVDIIAKFRQATELQELAMEYVSMVFADVKTMTAITDMEDNDIVDDCTKEGFILTNGILGELFNANLLTKKKFMTECLQPQFDTILQDIKAGVKPITRLELFLGLLNKSGKVLKASSIEPILTTMNQWVSEKKFQGKVHYNMMDTLDASKRWN